MKNIFKICWIFAGCFLGAGFVSGQELWQFFGNFGSGGIAGLVISIAVLAVLGMMIMSIAGKAQTSRMDEIVLVKSPKALSVAIGLFQVIFLFGIITVMIAGAGELAGMLTGIKTYVASAVMAVVIIAISITGPEGIAHVFSVCVPLIIVITVIVAIASQFCFAEAAVEIPHTENVLIPNWAVAAFTYAAYNIFGSVGVLAPFGKATGNTKLSAKGIAFGGLVLLIISLGILTALSKYPEALSAGLPMLALAERISPVLGYVYGITLLCGLLGSSTSSTVAVEHYVSEKYEFVKKRKNLFIVLLVMLAYVMSMFGFGNLVGTVYPVFGYMSAVLVVIMTVNFFKLGCLTKKQKKV